MMMMMMMMMMITTQTVLNTEPDGSDLVLWYSEGNDKLLPK